MVFAVILAGAYWAEFSCPGLFTAVPYVFEMQMRLELLKT